MARSSFDTGQAGSSVSPWLSEYLLGVAAEYDLDLQVDGDLGIAGASPAVPSTDRDPGCDPLGEARRRSANARSAITGACSTFALTPTGGTIGRRPHAMSSLHSPRRQNIWITA